MTEPKNGGTLAFFEKALRDKGSASGEPRIVRPYGDARVGATPEVGERVRLTPSPLVVIETLYYSCRFKERSRHVILE